MYISPLIYSLRAGLILALCAVCGLMSGCSIVERVEVEVIYTPQLHSQFDAKNSIVGINNARVFVYTADGLLLRDTLFPRERLLSSEPIIVIKGIADGEYRVVSYYNTDQMIIRGNFPNTSMLSDLDVALPKYVTPKSTENRKIDSICFDNSAFVVQRGTPTVMNMPINPIHYFVTVTVSGLERVTVEVGEIGVDLLDIPSSIGANGEVRSKYNLKVNLEELSSDEWYGQTMSLMFKDSDNARLRVKENGVAIQTLPLQPQNYFISGQPKNELNIEVQFYANSYVILVNSWKLGEFELVEMGG